MDTIGQSEPRWRDSTKFSMTSSNPAINEKYNISGSENNVRLNNVSDNKLTFDDFIDIINPLHHLPVIGTVYRKITGDELGSFSKILGGTLFLGPLGGISAVTNIIVNETTGKDVTGHAIALFDSTDSVQADVSRPSLKNVTIDPNLTSTKTSFYSNDLIKKARSNEPVDPVTAWAMAEASYRQSASNQIPTANNVTYREHNISQNNIAENHPDVVTEWARSETAYRKTNSKAIPISITNTNYLVNKIPSTTPKNNTNTLLALTTVPLEGGSLSAKNVVHSQKTIQNAVENYTRQEKISISNNNLAINKLTSEPKAGAIANGGGWFSDTMLSALKKHKNSEKPIQ